EAAMRLVIRVRSTTRSTRQSSRSAVSRETGTNFKARARSADISAAGPPDFATIVGSLAASAPTFRPFTPPQAAGQQCQRGWRHPIRPARLPQGSWTRGVELLPDFVGQPRDFAIVEILGHNQSLVAPISGYIGGLALKIDRILRVDLELIG